MVTLDPCKRLDAVKNQLIPAILKSARENTTSDIRTAIEVNLPALEESCQKLADKCEETWPDCKKKVDLCNRENIKKLFAKTREELEQIWIERERQEKGAAGVL